MEEPGWQDAQGTRGPLIGDSRGSEPGALRHRRNLRLRLGIPRFGDERHHPPVVVHPGVHRGSDSVERAKRAAQNAGDALLMDPKGTERTGTMAETCILPGVAEWTEGPKRR